MTNQNNNIKESDDLKEVIFNTIYFFKKHYVTLVVFVGLGLGIGFFTSKNTSEKYATFFVVENGGLPNDIIKDVAYPDSTQNFTNLTQGEYLEELNRLKNVTSIIADTTGRSSSIKYNLELSDTSNLVDVQNSIITFLGTNQYASEYTKGELNRFKDEIKETNSQIDLLNDSTATLNKNSLIDLLNRNETLRNKQAKIGRFDLIQPIQEANKFSLELKSYLLIGAFLGLVLGIVFGYLKDILSNFRK